MEDNATRFKHAAYAIDRNELADLLGCIFEFADYPAEAQDDPAQLAQRLDTILEELETRLDFGDGI